MGRQTFYGLLYRMKIYSAMQSFIWRRKSPSLLQGEMTFSRPSIYRTPFLIPELENQLKTLYKKDTSLNVFYTNETYYSPIGLLQIGDFLQVDHLQILCLLQASHPGIPQTKQLFQDLKSPKVIPTFTNIYIFCRPCTVGRNSLLQVLCKPKTSSFWSSIDERHSFFRRPSSIRSSIGKIPYTIF